MNFHCNSLDSILEKSNPVLSSMIGLRRHVARITFQVSSEFCQSVAASPPLTVIIGLTFIKLFSIRYSLLVSSFNTKIFKNKNNIFKNIFQQNARHQILIIHLMNFRTCNFTLSSFSIEVIMENKKNTLRFLYLKS